LHNSLIVLHGFGYNICYFCSSENGRLIAVSMANILGWLAV